jgi:hypothetical protein
MYMEGILTDSRDNIYNQQVVFPNIGANTDAKDCLFMSTTDKIDFSECAQTNLPFVCQFLSY